MAPHLRSSGYLLFALSLVFFDITGTLATPSWNHDVIEVKQGEDVDITCTVSGLNALGVVRILKSNKDKQYPISDNDQPKDPFATTGRYRTTYDYDQVSRVGVVRLRLDGAQVVDSGRIGCLRLGDSDGENIGYVQLKVFAPVIDLYIAHLTPGGDSRKMHTSDTIDFTEKEKNGVLCRAYADTLDMKMQIKIGGVDRTDMFLPEVMEEVVGSGGLSAIRKTITLQYVSDNPTHEFNMKTMTCIVTTEGHEPESTSVSLTVLFGPIVTCDKSEMYVKIGESVKIMCEVRANPGSVLQWHYGENKELIKNYQVDSNLRSAEEALSEDHAAVRMVINKLTKAELTTFYLIANNGYGITETSVVLRDISERPVPVQRSSQELNPGYTHNEPSAKDVRDGNSATAVVPGWILLKVLLVVTFVVLLSNTL